MNFSRFRNLINFSLFNFSQISKVTHFCMDYTLDRLKKIFAKKKLFMENNMWKFWSSLASSISKYWTFPILTKSLTFLRTTKQVEEKSDFWKKNFPVKNSKFKILIFQDFRSSFNFSVLLSSQIGKITRQTGQ